MPYQNYNAGDWRVAEDADVEEWANDPKCNQQKECAAELAKRRGRAGGEKLQFEKDREWLIANPFDPRKEVSADAKKIVRHLWILLFVIPIIVGVLLVLVHNLR